MRHVASRSTDLLCAVVMGWRSVGVGVSPGLGRPLGSERGQGRWPLRAPRAAMHDAAQATPAQATPELHHLHCLQPQPQPRGGVQWWTETAVGGRWCPATKRETGVAQRSASRERGVCGSKDTSGQVRRINQAPLPELDPSWVRRPWQP